MKTSLRNDLSQDEIVLVKGVKFFCYIRNIVMMVGEYKFLHIRNVLIGQISTIMRYTLNYFSTDLYSITEHEFLIKLKYHKPFSHSQLLRTHNLVAKYITVH